jgi:GDPmannose 4,6-dehydratase
LEFVTRKITDGVARFNAGEGNCIVLGNLDASRDWGYAPEFVEGMYRMMQHDTSDNFVLATNRAVTVKRFTELAFEVIGTEIIWEGAGVKEKGIDWQK